MSGLIGEIPKQTEFCKVELANPPRTPPKLAKPQIVQSGPPPFGPPPLRYLCSLIREFGQFPTNSQISRFLAIWPGPCQTSWVPPKSSEPCYVAISGHPWPCWLGLCRFLEYISDGYSSWSGLVSHNVFVWYKWSGLVFRIAHQCLVIGENTLIS